MGALSYVVLRAVREELQPVVQRHPPVRPDDGPSRDYLSHFGILLFLIAGFVLFSLNRSITRDDRRARRSSSARTRRREPVETAPVMAR